jgi:hypothetical protein
LGLCCGGVVKVSLDGMRGACMMFALFWWFVVLFFGCYSSLQE